jgi:hypothetical protein
MGLSKHWIRVVLTRKLNINAWEAGTAVVSGGACAARTRGSCVAADGRVLSLSRHAFAFGGIATTPLAAAMWQLPLSSSRIRFLSS